MDMEDQVGRAIVAELRRQAEINGELQVSEDGEGGLTLQGRVDLEQLAMAVVGKVAGGP